ncbi:unnamed protein product, partial [Amoebophrya sp. A25]
DYIEKAKVPVQSVELLPGTPARVRTDIDVARLNYLNGVRQGLGFNDKELESEYASLMDSLDDKRTADDGGPDFTKSYWRRVRFPVSLMVAEENLCWLAYPSKTKRYGIKDTDQDAVDDDDDEQQDEQKEDPDRRRIRKRFIRRVVEGVNVLNKGEQDSWKRVISLKGVADGVKEYLKQEENSRAGDAMKPSGDKADFNEWCAPSLRAATGRTKFHLGSPRKDAFVVVFKPGSRDFEWRTATGKRTTEVQKGSTSGGSRK